jgi:hypothetical protein
MSLTKCPGDAAYPLVKQAFPGEVAAWLEARAAPSPAPAGESAEQTAAPSPSASAETATTAPAATETARQDGVAAGDGGVEVPTVALIAAGVAAAGATVGLVQYARQHSAATKQPTDFKVPPPDLSLVDRGRRTQWLGSYLRRSLAEAHQGSDGPADHRERRSAGLGVGTSGGT